MAGRVKFTVPFVKNVVCPPERRCLYLYDELCPSLELQAYGTGGKTYYLNFRHPATGKPTRVKLGKANILSPDQARELCRAKQAQAATGVTAQELRGTAPKSKGFGDWFIVYREHLITKGARPTTIENFDIWHRLYIAPFLDKVSLQDIDCPLLEEVQHRALGTGERPKFTTANRVVATIRNVFSFAVKRGGYHDKSPTSHLTRFPEQRRVRYVEESEIGSFLRTVWGMRGVDEMTADVVLLALYSGVRKSCLLEARWDQFEQTQDCWIWTIPSTAKGNKSRKLTRVVLSRSPSRVLSERRAMQNGSPYVFPSPESAKGHLREPKKAFPRIEARSAGGVKPGLSMHALRHTFITYGNWAGIAPQALRCLAGHAPGGTAHEGYIHYPDNVLFDLACRVEDQIHTRGKFRPPLFTTRRAM